MAAVPNGSDVVLDISVELSLEVGRTTMNIRRLLQLNAGTVIELDRPAGDPLDVFVNGRLVAHGEVVMVNDRYGLRFTEAVAGGGTRD
jgi:flagellar motor switch protein FliN/FliY